MEKINLVEKYFQGMEQFFDKRNSTIVEVVYEVSYDEWAFEAQMAWLRDKLKEFKFLTSQYDFQIVEISFDGDKKRKQEVLKILLSIRGGLKVESSLNMNNETMKSITNGIKKKLAMWFIDYCNIKNIYENLLLMSDTPLTIDVHISDGCYLRDLDDNGLLINKIKNLLKESFFARLVNVNPKYHSGNDNKSFMFQIDISFIQITELKKAKSLFDCDIDNLIFHPVFKKL